MQTSLLIGEKDIAPNPGKRGEGEVPAPGEAEGWVTTAARPARTARHARTHAGEGADPPAVPRWVTNRSCRVTRRATTWVPGVKALLGSEDGCEKLFGSKM